MFVNQPAAAAVVVVAARFVEEACFYNLYTLHFLDEAGGSCMKRK